MIGTGQGVYRTPTIILQDAARRLPFGQGTFPLGGGMYRRTQDTAVQEWRPYDYSAILRENMAARVLPFGQGTFPLGKGTYDQAEQFDVQTPAYVPYSLVLENFARQPIQTFLQTPISSPIGTSFRDATYAGWVAPDETWIMERSPDWSVLESFTPPPPPADPPLKSLWEYQTKVVAERNPGRYILIHQPAYFEVHPDDPPVGDWFNRTQALNALTFKPLQALIPPPLSLVQAGPRRDAPPIGGYAQRWVQAMFAAETRSLILQGRATAELPKPDPSGKWFNRQLEMTLAAAAASYSPVLQPRDRLGQFLRSGADLPSIGNPLALAPVLAALTRPPAPDLPTFWYALGGRRLPIGVGAFPLGGALADQTAKALVAEWAAFAPYARISETQVRQVIRPLGLGVFPLGSGTTRQASHLLAQAWPTFEPYGLILEAFGHPPIQTFLQTVVQNPSGDPFRTATLLGWAAPDEVWILERAPDWSVLESFTPPPPPANPPLKGLWDAPALQMALRNPGRFLLVHEPTYDQTQPEAPPIGNDPNALAAELIATWDAYAPKSTVRERLLSIILAPARTDPPPVGGYSQRWIQAQFARETPSLILQRLVTLPITGIAEVPSGNLLGRLQESYRASQITEPYFKILEPYGRLGELITPPPSAPPLGVPLWWLHMLYWLTKPPTPDLPAFWYAQLFRRNILVTPPASPPVGGQRRKTPLYLRRLRLLELRRQNPENML